MQNAVIQVSAEKQKNNYPDVGDNVYAKVQGWLDTTCGNNKQWFIPGRCEDKGHRYAKIIVCGKEWCAVCGCMGSMAHNRRYVRWLSKIMQFKSMRYFVFTIPEELRCNYRTKKSLTDLGRKAQEMMKRHGFDRGMRRWHWFGDRSHKWHPHLNILVEGSYLNDNELVSIKRGWARILKTSKENARVSYKPKPADMAGCLHYITRATFLEYEYDIEMAQELRGFRNMVVWGQKKFKKEPVWSLSPAERKAAAGENLNVEAIEKMIEHKCPKCGSHLTWQTALPAELLRVLDKESYGAGYYRIIDRAGPLLEDTILTRLAYERGKHVAQRVEEYKRLLELKRLDFERRKAKLSEMSPLN